MTATTKWAALAAALVIGCASSTAIQAQTASKPQKQKPAQQTSVPAGKSVCVASALGHQFAVQKIGLMVFGNSLQHATIDSWGIDDAAVRRIAQIAGDSGYSVRRVAMPPPPADANAPFSGWLSNPVQTQLRAMAAASPKCSLYIMVKPSGRNYEGTNQVLTGLGIVDTPGFFERIFVFASIGVSVYDGDTLNALKVSFPTSYVANLMAAPTAMYKQVDKSWLPATPQAAAQSAQLKNATRTLIEEGMSKAMMGVFDGSLTQQESNRRPD